MKKVLVIGFPHCGTSILRCKLGEAVNVFDVQNETDFFTREHIRNAKIQNKKVILGKTPFIPEIIRNKGMSIKKFSEYYDYYFIFIIRNPRYCLTSIYNRFNKFPPNHNFESYLHTANLFLESKNRIYNKVYTVKYEDLFQEKNREFENIARFSKLNLNIQNIITKSKEYKVVTMIPLPKEKPISVKEGAGHESYRTWQINQDFVNMNNKIDLPEKLLEEIEKNNLIKQLGY